MSFTFYLGVHKPSWLAFMNVPLFLSFATIRDRDSLWKAADRWAMDSGGFMELSLRGSWTVSPVEYTRVVRRCVNEIGKLDWATIQDWMCEPWILEKTGMTVVQHQCLTIRSLLDLRSMAPELPWAPVVQGWAWPDYDRHVEMYARYGIDLTAEPIVGVGSVCRRQSTLQAGAIFASMLRVGLERLHGFGLKTTGLIDNAPLLRSADSTSWSEDARRSEPMAGHHHGADGKGKCNNCPEYALWWRKQVLVKAEEGIARDIWERDAVPWKDNPIEAGEPVIIGTVGERSYYGSKRGRQWSWIDDAGCSVVCDAGTTEAGAKRTLRALIDPYVPTGALQFGEVHIPR